MPPSTPLRNPLAYFRRVDRPSIGVAAGVVLVNAIATTALVWWFVDSALGRIDAPRDEIAQARDAVSGQLVVIFVSVFLGWLLLAAALHVFVWFADGDGGFGTTLAVVGEAEFVSFLVLPVVFAVFLSLLGQIPADPDAAADFLRRAAGRERPLLLLVSLVGTVWKAYITGHGLAEGHDVAREKTFALAAVFGILGFLIGLV